MSRVKLEAAPGSTYDVVVGPGDTRAEGLGSLAKAVKLARQWAGNAGLAAAGDVKVVEVRDGARRVVDKYGLVQGRVRKIQLAAE